MNITQEELRKQMKNSFNEGFEAGIREYSWMKDGILYVGTTGTTLKKALSEIKW